MRRSSVVTGVLGLLLLAMSAVGLASAEAAGPVRSDVVAGIPVTLYASDASDSAPTVIVAHGFSGSAHMVDPLARGLNRAGFTVVTFDFPGHGANPEPLMMGADVRSADSDILLTTLSEVVDWTAAQPEVDRSSIALLGHSMGAIAVTDYAGLDAAGDGRITATVALSLPTAQQITSNVASIPRDLMLLYGSLEPEVFAQASMDALNTAYPNAVIDTTYGDLENGTARKAQEIPNVEHITILYSEATLQAATTWLGLAFDVGPASTSLPPVLLYAVAALIAGGLLLVPLSRGLLRPGPDIEEGAVKGWQAISVTVVAALFGAIGAWATVPLQDYIPVAVGGYLAVWFACAGALTLAWWVITRRGRRPWPSITWRSSFAAALVTLLALAVIAIPGLLTWAPFSFVGPRWWLTLLMLVPFGLYFASDELLVRRAASGARFGLTILNRLIAVGVILAAIPVLGAPGFLILVMPILLLFLLVLAWYAAIIASRHNGFLGAVAVQAVPAAVLVATAFPLLG